VTKISWQDRLFTQLSPELLTGVTFGRWWQILRENSFSIDLRYWPRAYVTTLFSLRNSAASAIERVAYQRAIRRTKVTSPLFILGIFRSGTSYLQNLMAQDKRLAFPSMYEVTFPQTFLTTQRLDSAIFGPFMPKARPQDNVALSFDLPHEDEVAFCAMLGRTFLLDMVFPRNTAFYRRYYTLKDISLQEREDWKQALRWFAQKLTYKHLRPLVFKSPGHTCRIKTILEIFPDAKFVHIHRHPYETYQSWQHLIHSVSSRWGLQRNENEALDNDIVQQYAEVYDTYLAERHLIPEGRLCEVAYQDLKSDPLTNLKHIYDRLELPDFAGTEAQMQSYIEGDRDYQKNKYSPLDESIKKHLAREWKRFFEAWGYEHV